MHVMHALYTALRITVMFSSAKAIINCKIAAWFLCLVLKMLLRIPKMRHFGILRCPCLEHPKKAFMHKWTPRSS